jgi:hypothetical protein
MLQQPMKEKLHALKLQGMIEALEYQEQDEATRELNFLDCLALLVDQQWNWRENRALTRRVLAARLRGTACAENIDYRAERGLNRSVIRALAQESAWVANHEHIFVLGPTCGQELCGFGTGAESLPGWLSGVLHEGRGAVPGSKLGTCRWQSTATVEEAEPDRCSGRRRLGHEPDGGNGEKRLLGDRRGSLPDALDDSDFAVASGPLA